MHVVCTLAGGVKMEFDGNTEAEVFRRMSRVAEIFGEPGCGCCKSTNICVRVRKAQEYEYFEWWCRDCDARLDVGQNQQGGTLFIKRWDKDARAMKPDNGWYHYTAGNQQNQDHGDGGGYQEPRGQQSRGQQQRRSAPASHGGGNGPESSGDIPF